MSDRLLFSWLHLSDIHAGHGDERHGFDQSFVMDCACADVADLPAGCPPPQAILVTGDLAFSGGVVHNDEYTKVGRWLEQMAGALGLDMEAVLAVPGNHDADRGQAKADPILQACLEGVRRGDLELDKVLKAGGLALDRRFDGFLKFAARTGLGDLATADALAWTRRFGPEDGPYVHLAGLNTALLSQDGADFSRLRLGTKQLELVLGEVGVRPAKDVALFLAHHPLDWLADGSETRRYLGAMGHGWLSGHVHVARSVRERHGNGDGFVYVTAGTVHGDQGQVASWAYWYGAVYENSAGQIVLRLWPVRWHENRFVDDKALVPPHKDFAEHLLRDAPPQARSPEAPPAAKPAPSPAPRKRRSAKAYGGSTLELFRGASEVEAPRYKAPLAVHVVWHEGCRRGWPLAHTVFARCARDPADPLSSGLGIPVRLWRGATPPAELPFDDADRTVVVLLADENLLDDQPWRDHIEALAARVERAPGHRFLLPVALAEGLRKVPKVRKHQVLDLYATGAEARWAERLSNVLAHHLVRALRAEGDEPAPKLRVFLSHAKRDGEAVALEIRERLEDGQDQGLDTFFDRDAIADGFRFDVQLIQALEQEQAVLLAVQTDSFASRSWCRREVLTAKRLGRPVVVVHAVDQFEPRSCPYLGNVPVLRWAPQTTGFWSRLLGTILDEALRFAWLPLELAAVARAGGVEPSLCLPHPPELLSFWRAQVDEPGTVLYPDPPLASDELETLRHAFPTQRVTTPAHLGITTPRSTS